MPEAMHVTDRGGRNGQSSGVAARPAGRESPQELLGPAGYLRLRNVLRREESFDLDAYRTTYLGRRLRSRLATTKVRGDAYPDLVARDPAERRALMETLGVNVSGFFRDPAVWTFLEDVALPPLIEARAASGDPLRVASIGCAGGEEPYSAAMLLAEAVAGTPVRFRVDAFDVDPHALATARHATYSRETLEPVSHAGLARYFRDGDDGRLTVAPALRRRVRIRRLDALTQPLPGRYDLILCRNMMIYLDAATKPLLLGKLHRALADDGLFVLGQSEVLLGEASGRFRALCPRNRIYRKVI